MSEPKRFVTYIGNEKFKPAEGYFALGEVQPMYMDEFNTVTVANQTIYISPWVYYTDQQDVFEDLIPYIYAYPQNPSLDIAILFKRTDGYIYEGGCAMWSDYGMPDKTVNAYIESSTLYPYNSVEYIKVYLLEDYDTQNYAGWREQDLDDYSAGYIKLYAKQYGNRYIWSLTP